VNCTCGAPILHFPACFAGTVPVVCQACHDKAVAHELAHEGQWRCSEGRHYAPADAFDIDRRTGVPFPSCRAHREAKRQKRGGRPPRGAEVIITPSSNPLSLQSTAERR